jgi:hypothetical protein
MECISVIKLSKITVETRSNFLYPSVSYIQQFVFQILQPCFLYSAEIEPLRTKIKIWSRCVAIDKLGKIWNKEVVAKLEVFISRYWKPLKNPNRNNHCSDLESNGQL